MLRNKHRWLLVIMGLVLCWPGLVFADSSESPNYRVEQTFFGSGGQLDASSGSYSARQSLGELAVGLTESAAFRAYAGFNTTDEPYIEFFVNNSNLDIGVLETDQATYASGSFYVRAWQASGYVVQTESSPPENAGNNYQLAPLVAGGTSSPGTEQFGINLVLNPDECDPGCDVGADPVQVPDATFSFGEVEPGYDIPGTFKYNEGDIVAKSQQSTSVTIYTLSYLYNISNITPSGRYDFNHNLVATGTY